MKLSIDSRCVSAAFIYHYFIGEDGQRQILESAIQTGVPHTNLGILRAYKVPIPPLPEQTAIAAVLSDMDADLAAFEAKREKARALKEGMMQALLTGKIRLL
jgi:type I restriction enzyme, S subunit